MSGAGPGAASGLLREIDRDRYLATLVLPPEVREDIAALYAFSVEIAAIRSRAKVPAAGEIRLQWWIDALNGQGHGEVRQNPLARALLETVEKWDLPSAALVRLAEARRFDLYDDPMPDIAGFEGYAGETVSVLYQLGAMILNGGRPVETGDAAGHLGVGNALVGHLRAFGFNASQGRILLPREVFAICGVADEDIRAGSASDAVSIALTRFAQLAGEHLDKAQAAIAATPRALRPAFAPIAVLRAQLRRLDLDAPFAVQPDLPDWRKIVLLSWWRLRSG